MSNSYSNMISFGFGLPRLSIGWGKTPTIAIPPVTTHDVETAAEKRPRALKHLLKLNHANFSVLYHNLQFHNHNPHILGSAYILGATPEHLNDIYESEAGELDPWQDSPGEISEDDWREFLGKREYQRAFVDFFEDQLVQCNYDWRALLNKFLFDSKKPLVNNVISGLGHPLIHLAYAYELSSRTLAVEALALIASSYNFLHKYLDDPTYSQHASSPSSTAYSTPSPLEILQKVATDERFNGLASSFEALLSSQEAAVLEHWHAWTISDPRAQFEASQRAAAAILCGSDEPQDGLSSSGSGSGSDAAAGRHYDFYLVHLLTTSHAVRILLPLLPAKVQVPVVRQWWLLALLVYITQQRPAISPEAVDGYDLKGRDWAYVVERALRSEHALDAHFVKASRAMKEAAETWGDESEFFLKAAVKFAAEFNGWSFGASTEEETR